MRTGGEVGMTIEEWKDDFRSFICELTMPRDDYNSIMEYIMEGYNLLKAQEPVEPTEPDEDNTQYCGACGSAVGYEVLEPSGIGYIKYNYCPECGQEVKWDD